MDREPGIRHPALYNLIQLKRRDFRIVTTPWQGAPSAHPLRIMLLVVIVAACALAIAGQFEIREGS